MSAKKVKARKMWAYPAQVKTGEAYITTKRQSVTQDLRLFVVPADPKGYNLMVEQGARALIREPYGSTYGHNVSSVLASIGITPQK